MTLHSEADLRLGFTVQSYSVQPLPNHFGFLSLMLKANTSVLHYYELVDMCGCRQLLLSSRVINGDVVVKWTRECQSPHLSGTKSQ